MIRLHKFDVRIPTSLPEAVELLFHRGGNTKILAGGTDLMVGMKQGTLQPTTLLWLGKVRELQKLEFSEDEGLQIGAMCTLAEIESNEEVRHRFPALAKAIRSIASPQIRNRATVGGNLCLDTRCLFYDQSEFWRGSLGFCLKQGDGICHAAPGLTKCAAVFCSDLAPLLIALDARVEILNARSRRSIRLRQLYVNNGVSHLNMEPTDLLARITIPWDPAVRASHQKLRVRQSTDFPLANVGVAMSFDDRRQWRHATVIIGAIESAPIVILEKSARSATNQTPEQFITDLLEHITSQVHPLPTLNTPVSYRKNMVSVLVRRALEEIFSSN